MNIQKFISDARSVSGVAHGPLVSARQLSATVLRQYGGIRPFVVGLGSH
jgi:hypothetical protein